MLIGFALQEFEVGRLKVAIQDRAPVMLTTPSEQSLSPDQPPNVEPLVAFGVKVTLVL